MTNTVVPIRHLGQYRSVPDPKTGGSRPVTEEEMALDCRALTCSFRRGTQTSPMMANYLKVDHELLKVRLLQLAEWGMVDLLTTERTGSFRVKLTGSGEIHAMDILGQQDLERALESERLKRARGSGQ